jgi:antirestriction protein ArdC
MHELIAGAADNCPAGQEADRKVIPLIRSFTVFNAGQIDGLPVVMIPPPKTVFEWQACEAAEAILDTSGADIQYGGSRAFYSPSQDRIQLPNRSDFANAADFSRVALHELTHWSGHTNRCNRVLASRAHFEAYAFEELVAEMGSAFLTDHCGLPGALRHASYIESWLHALRNDKRLIFTAASQAQKAADYLLGPLQLEPDSEQVVEPMLQAA